MERSSRWRSRPRRTLPSRTTDPEKSGKQEDYESDRDYDSDSDDSDDVENNDEDYDYGDDNYSDHDSGLSSLSASPTARAPPDTALLAPPGRGHASRAYGGRPRSGRPYRRLGPLHFYRVPNRTARYVGMGIILFITIFILSLVRASQVENWKIVHGKVDKKPPPIHAWQSFRALQRYYGGIDTLATKDHNVPEYPAREPASPEDQARQAAGKKSARAAGTGSSKPFRTHPRSVHAARLKDANVTECFVDGDNKVRIPPIRYYDGRPSGFPDHAVGSYEELDLPDDVCFERFGRYGPYGFGYSVRTGGLGTGQYGEKNGSDSVWESHPVVDYRGVDWADVQRRCYLANARRFHPLPPREPENGYFVQDEPRPESRPDTDGSPPPRAGNSTLPHSEPVPEPEPDTLPRTALVLRVWDEYAWREEDIMNLRALIAELSMDSGGRYDVHLLMQVKNDAAHPVFADPEAYRERIRSTVPEEFRGLVTIWTQTQMLSLYQGIFDLQEPGGDHPVHGPYRGLSMALQYFASHHPEYDYFWQWEMDARYVGHYLDLFQKLEDWARRQPRKGLWERNERFYVPAVHGSWDEFKQMSKVQADMGTVGANNVWSGVGDRKKQKQGQQPDGSGPEPLVWGPARPSNPDDLLEPERDPVPPAKTSDADNYQWGVGEEADLISLYPMFDPIGTTWFFYEDITGYKTESLAIPRRAHIIVASRVSRRLLTTMHRETAYKKHFAFPEMWQATVALHHGYKAVAAPHPMYVEREWPSKYLAQTLNNGRNGASGGARTSVFGSREHNLEGLTWFYRSSFAGPFYRRWLGLRVDDVGGEQFETDRDLSKGDKNVEDLRGGEGRMCIPSMLIHPAKEVELPVEKIPEEEQAPVVPPSDPTA